MIIALHGFLGRPVDWNWLSDSVNETVSARDLFEDVFSIQSDDKSKNLKSTHEHCAFSQWATLLNSSAEDFLREAKEKPLLLGYSMGGRLAMHALIERPDLYRGAVLVSSHPGLKCTEERALRLETDLKWAKRFAEENWSEVLSDWNAQGVLQTPALKNSFDRKEEQFNRKALSLAMNHWSLGRQRDLRHELTKLDIPLFYVTGENDEKFTHLIQNLQLGSGHRHVIISKAGHRVPWEQPKSFAEALSEMLPGASVQ